MAEYDAAYKRLFESARLVEDLLREALAEHPKFINAIDFTTMRRLPGELITESLHKRFIDTVWQIEQIGHHGSVVVVLEFQSTVDADMGLRMLAYSSVLLQSLIGQERSRSTLARSYPTLVPVVLYNGRPRWSTALDVRQRFDVIEDGLLRYQPSQCYLLVDEKQWVGPLPGHCALFRALVNIIHSTSLEQVASALAAVDECLDDERDRRLKQGIADLFEASAREEYRGFDKLPGGNYDGRNVQPTIGIDERVAPRSGWKKDVKKDRKLVRQRVWRKVRKLVWQKVRQRVWQKEPDPFCRTC